MTKVVFGRRNGTARVATSARTRVKRKPRIPRALSASVTKAFGIVELLATQPAQGSSLSSLSHYLRMPKSTLHRYLTTLVGLGVVERDGIDRFRLGPKLVELAGSFLSNNDIRAESIPFLEELAAASGETIHLAIPSGDEVVHIAQVESIHTVRMYSYIGARLPMHATALGKAILAQLPAANLEEFLSGSLVARTPHTIVSASAMTVELDRVREQGFAIDDEESEPSLRCVGAAILDYSKTTVAAISISGPSNRMNS